MCLIVVKHILLAHIRSKFNFFYFSYSNNGGFISFPKNTRTTFSIARYNIIDYGVFYVYDGSRSRFSLRKFWQLLHHHRENTYCSQYQHYCIYSSTNGVRNVLIFLRLHTRQNYTALAQREIKNAM